MGSGPTPVQSTSFPRTVDARELRVPLPEFDRRTRVLKFATSAFILGLYTVLRLRHLSQYSLWYDEVFSVIAARSSWGEMFRQILIDRVHPPVFYVCLKVWIAVIGDSIVRLRLFSVFFSSVTLVPVWNCLKRTRLSPSISLALLLAIACNPFLIFYAQEVRMYALLGFLAACSLSLYLADEENQTELWLLSVVNVLLVMTHAAGAAVVGCELVHALIARKNGGKYMAVACGPALLSFASWMFSVKFLAPHPAMVLHNVSWIPRPTFSLAWKALAHILGGTAALIVLNIPIANACFRRIRDRQFLLLLILSVATIAFAFAFSVTVHPVWQERYLIICVIPYYLLAGWSVAKLSANWRFAGSVAIALAALVSLEQDLIHRPDRPNFAAFLSIAKASQLPVLSSYDVLAAPLALGIGDQDQSRVQVIKSIADQSSADPTFITRDIAYSVGQRDWIQDQRSVSAQEFLYAWDNSDDPLLPAGIKPADLISRGCNLQELARTHGQGHVFTLFHASCK